ncbi:histone H1, gonadal-like [Diorhabda carinulata]|uniref:histone H1, gonadal-like n=1 Tax=Diorhabda carinulata TaxID=1163345 RepID=UPI0025A182D3|nr:histone H1, gonadal-like [Diorhabda carinulata]
MAALITDVMSSIATLKDRRGSSLDEIINHINSQRKTKLKNASMQVKKALTTGIQNGLLKKANGKFKLGISSKQFTMFQNFKNLEKRRAPVKEMQARGRRQQGKQRSLIRSAKNKQKEESSRISKLAKNLKLPIIEIRSRGRRPKNTRRRRRRTKRRRHDVHTKAEPMDRSRRPRRKGTKRRQRRPRRSSKYGRRK